MKTHDKKSDGTPGCGRPMMALPTSNLTSSEYYCKECHDSIKMDPREAAGMLGVSLRQTEQRR